MKKFFTAIIAGLTAMLFIFGGCVDGTDGGDRLTGKRYTFLAMNTTATLVAYDYFSSDGDAEERFIQLKDTTAELLYNLNASLSATLPTSYVTMFNEAEAGDRVKIDGYAYEVLSIALNVYNMTDGYYNPAVFYGVQSFGFNGAKEKPPTKEELPPEEETDAYADLASHFGELKLEEEEGEYYAIKPEYTVTVNDKTLSMRVDLGGIAKGYAVDLIDVLISEYGFEYGYINFGSSSIALKKHVNGDFELHLTDPRDSFSSVGYFSTKLTDVKLSSSGDYENYFTLEDKRYCHIFDPHTARPVQTGMMTATVIGGSAAEDDALTTALMAMGAERAIEFISEKISERSVIFSCEVGGAYRYYTNLTEGYTVENKNYTPYSQS